MTIGSGAETSVGGAAAVRYGGSTASAASLEDLEAILAARGASFSDVGGALDQIRRGRLHRLAGYRGFRGYVIGRWGLSAT